MIEYLALLGFLTWLLARGTEELGYTWHWFRVPRYIFAFDDGQFIPRALLKGFLVTLQISGASFLLAFCFGLVTAIFRMSRSFTAQLVARTYLELVRNTPLLILLFFIYFVLSPVLGISRFFSAVLALSLFEGAYASEIIRAGIHSIRKGQWEAAHSLGLTTVQTYVHIILPQAVRSVLPPLTSQTVSLVKDSALVSTIAIYDLTMQGQAIVARTFLAFEIWFTVALMYLVLTLSLSLLANGLEKKFGPA